MIRAYARQATTADSSCGRQFDREMGAVGRLTKPMPTARLHATLDIHMFAELGRKQMNKARRGERTPILSSVWVLCDSAEMMSETDDAAFPRKY